MYMAVEKPGEHGPSAQIDNLCAIGNSDTGSYLFDHAVFHQDAAAGEDGLADHIHEISVGK